jgi:hypothetical protein
VKFYSFGIEQPRKARSDSQTTIAAVLSVFHVGNAANGSDSWVEPVATRILGYCFVVRDSSKKGGKKVRLGIPLRT